jgi:CelD/BcsL family acetyltransferase involved in cellulose biosynthesis
MITCGGDIVSASVNIAEGPSVGAFFAVYNPKFDRASPGIMLMTAYTRWAFNNGFTEIDYLRGGEGYKLEFANAQTTLMSFVAAGSPLGRAALFTHRLWYHIAKFRESRKNPSRKGGAYTTKAGNARTMTLAE